MKKISLPGDLGILMVEKSDYPLTLKKLEEAHIRLNTGMIVWRRGADRHTGHREILVDFGNNGPCMFESRKTLLSMMRHYNNIWRWKKGKWPLE